MRRSSKCFKIIHHLILPFNKSCKCLGLSFSDEVTETQRRKIIVLKVPKSKSVGAKVCTQHSACPLRTGIPHWGHATPPHRFRTNRSFPLLTDCAVHVTTCSLIKDNFTYRESIQGIKRQLFQLAHSTASCPLGSSPARVCFYSLGGLESVQGAGGSQIFKGYYCSDFKSSFSRKTLCPVVHIQMFLNSYYLKRRRKDTYKPTLASIRVSSGNIQPEF